MRIAVLAFCVLVVSLLGRPAGAAVDTVRIARFDRFLEEAAALYRRAGATPLQPRARFGYAEADLIDPAVVTNELVHSLERYASYRRLLREAPSQPNVPAILDRPFGSSTPEDLVTGAGDGLTDATGAVERALAKGDVWLTPGRVYLIHHTITIPAHRRILSDGTGTILIVPGGVGFPDTAYDPTHAYRGYSDVIRIHDVDGVELRDFRLQTPIADARVPQPLLHGVDVRKAHHVSLMGLELRGFPRTRGVIRVNSSDDVVIAGNLIHGSFTRELTRQVTAIEIDEARSEISHGVPRASQNLRITGNFVFGMLLSPAVYLDTTLRGGALLDDETDGINLASTASAASFTIQGNVIADVGQGIDLFTSDGRITDTVIERTPEFGLKMGHGASRNSFDRLRITASGIAAVFIYGLPGENASENSITNLSLRYPDAVIGLPRTRAYALEIGAKGGATAATVARNSFAHVRVTGAPRRGEGGWRGMIACGWPRITQQSEAAPNLFLDVSPNGPVGSSGGCLTSR